jgi:farnesyl-diphosphate farnesyltransferase
MTDTVAGYSTTPPSGAREADRFCRDILPAVSRTFTLSIRILPGTLGRAVRTAYLICRIADTIEDEPELSPQEKAVHFGRLLSAFDDAAAADAFSPGIARLTGEAAHVRLVRGAGFVFAEYRALPARTRDILRRWIGEMVVGMRKFVGLFPAGIRIRTLDEYREYCYYVAGTVGFLLTDLWPAHSAAIDLGLHERLLERCRAFAEGLQTVNILKDIDRDATVENSIYIPDDFLRAHGSSHDGLLKPELVGNNVNATRQLIRLAGEDLDLARDYLMMLPRRAVPIRLFCLFPLLFARATLRDLSVGTAYVLPGPTVKISRREVRSLLLAGAVMVGSNRALAWLIERVRNRPFLLPGA